MHSDQLLRPKQSVEQGRTSNLAKTPEMLVSAAGSQNDQPAVADTLSTKGVVEEEPLPNGWEVAFTSSGKIYYKNHNKKTTSWNRPRPDEPNDDDQADDPLPAGWESRLDAKGRKYYTNHTEKTTTWIHPSHLDSVLGPLPEGWEMRLTDWKQVYFVDHSTRTTTWTDPRKAGYIANEDSRAKFLRKALYLHMMRRKKVVSGVWEMKIRRSYVLDDSFGVISETDLEDLKRRPVVILDEKESTNSDTR